MPVDVVGVDLDRLLVVITEKLLFFSITGFFVEVDILSDFDLDIFLGGEGSVFSS